jgi:HlyD family secretion protein
MITQILDFGVPSQIDVQISGRHSTKDLQVAQKIASKLRLTRGAVDVHLQQITNAPEFFVKVDKERVARSAVALQSSSRSMRTEVDVPNPDHVLRPGLFADVTFSIPRQTPALVVPDAALVFNAGGLQVATVGADDAIHFQKVTIYRDFGITAKLRAGLAGGENLVLSPPAELANGSKVQVANPPQQQEGVKPTASR